MGGFPKGLLREPTFAQPLAGRLVQLAYELELYPVWVGRAAAYRELAPEVSELCDEPEGVGPLGGLTSLLRAAQDAQVLAVACDMPYVSSELLRRLLAEEREAAAFAPRNREGFWEPLCARYHAQRVLPVCEAMLGRGESSLQKLFSAVSARELKLQGNEWRNLRDWDCPEDLEPNGGPGID